MRISVLQHMGSEMSRPSRSTIRSAQTLVHVICRCRPLSFLSCHALTSTSGTAVHEDIKGGEEGRLFVRDFRTASSDTSAVSGPAVHEPSIPSALSSSYMFLHLRRKCKGERPGNADDSVCFTCVREKKLCA